MSPTPEQIEEALAKAAVQPARPTLIAPSAVPSSQEIESAISTLEVTQEEAIRAAQEAETARAYVESLIAARQSAETSELVKVLRQRGFNIDQVTSFVRLGCTSGYDEAVNFMSRNFISAATAKLVTSLQSTVTRERAISECTERMLMSLTQ